MKRLTAVLLCVALVFSLAFGASAADKPYADSEFFTYEDYTLHYRTVEHSGSFKGRIAMLHGFVCSTYAWRNMAEGLSREGYDCVLIDLPNFGYSTRESEEIAPVDREALVVELLSSIAPMEEWILAGHSMGGGVCINIAEEYSVQALLLYCPAPQQTIPAQLGKVMTSRVVRAAMDAFFDVGLYITPVVRLVIYAATLDWKFAKEYDVSGVTAPLQHSGSGSGMCYMMSRVRATDLASASKIKAPVLLVQAQGDIVLTSSMKEEVEAAFPNAQKYVVEGGGHQCIENRADELTSLTVEFLKNSK